MTTLLSLATLSLLTLYGGLALCGILLIVRRRGLWRSTGVALLILASLATAMQVALSTLSPGIGEPFIRVRLADLLAQVGGALLVVGATAGLLALGLRRLDGWLMGQRRRAPAIVGLLVALPALAGLSMYAMVAAGTPARERERDPQRREISVPEGFVWSVYARSDEWDNPTVMTFGPDGSLYVGDISGALWAVSDTRGGTGGAAISRLADGFQLLLGLAWRDGELFVASQGKIEALRDGDGDGSLESRRLVVEGLPSMVLRPHSNNSITFGPDGRLYFGVGSTSDTDVEQHELAAAVLSVNPDGSDMRVYARGFGNPFAVAFNSEGQLFGGDNSNRSEPDEFNHIVEGEHYGFPYYYGDPPEGGTTGALVTFPAHSVPTGVTFYSGASFPAEYRDNAFLTLWSSGELRRIEVARTTGGSYLSRTTTFGSGFLYPIGVVTGPDGALYVADFGTSAIYRIAPEL
jgi:glucose/arabinose dehydrogenase